MPHHQFIMDVISANLQFFNIFNVQQTVENVTNGSLHVAMTNRFT